ncbi:MAG: hypothetical protein N3A54_05650, partial [Patescibacteria group bacterium]|nr:hypothetical protein [Patescibacteria group bacterium]
MIQSYYMHRLSPRIIDFLIHGMLGIGILILLFLRMEVASQRFFDVDEFTHMHWAGQIFRGEKPYIDFFTFFPPGFHWMLQPLFMLFPQSAMMFIAGRYLSIVGFVGILVVLAVFFARLRSPRYALIPAFILAFLPMPYDKYFEIRPDTWSTFFGFLGVFMLSIGWSRLQNQNKSHRTIRIFFFLAGFFLAVCLIILPKMLPFVILAGLIEALRTSSVIWSKRKEIQKNTATRQLLLMGEPLIFFMLGGVIVVSAFFLWMISLGNFGEVWYSLTKQGVEGNQVGKYFIMEP